MSVNLIIHHIYKKVSSLLPKPNNKLNPDKILKRLMDIVVLPLVFPGWCVKAESLILGYGAVGFYKA